VGWADPANWARLSPRKRRAKIGPKWLGRTRHIIFFSLLGWAGPNPYIWSGPNQVRPISHINYFCRNMNRYCSRSACNQTVAEAVGGRRRRLPSAVVTDVMRRLSWWPRWRRCEERWKSWRPVAEEAKEEEEENGRGCREERERFTMALGGRLVASCGGADGGKTSDEGGGGWRPRWREKKENGSVAGKLSKEGWFFAMFGPDFLLP